MTITKRLVKGSALTHAEGDANLDHFLVLDTATQAAIAAKVANDLSASTTVAPSKTAVNGAIAVLLPKAGGVLTGAITLAGDAANALEPVSKQQFDNALQGMKSKGNALVRTAAALPANTYANGAAGVGATLTGNANGALTVDGVAATVGDTYVIADEVAQLKNGLYVVTAAGSAGAPYVLTRSPLMDLAGEFAGAFVIVTGGTKAGSIYYATFSGAFVVGTTALTWTASSATLASTDALTEGATNQYFTVQRVRAAVLTGIDLATNAVVLATDSVMAAIGKLSARLEALITTVAGKASVNQTFGFGFGIPGALANQDYAVSISFPFPVTFTKVESKCGAGTATATSKIGATAFGGAPNAVSTVLQAQAHATANLIAAGQALNLTISANAGCTDASFVYTFTRVMS